MEGQAKDLSLSGNHISCGVEETMEFLERKVEPLPTSQEGAAGRWAEPRRVCSWGSWGGAGRQSSLWRQETVTLLRGQVTPL